MAEKVPSAPAEKTARSGFHREFWVILSPGLLVTFLGFLLALSFVGAPPPKTLRFAGGPGWGAYNQFALQYKNQLKAEGLNIEVLETRGSTENLRLLAEGKADLAFVQGGIKPLDSAVQLVSLGSVYYEPLWLFVRKLDAVFFIGSPTIPAIKRMLRAPEIQLMQFRHAKALERRHQFLSTLELYEGVVDLKQNIPHQDMQLLAPAATLVVREEFHKALPPVILAAAKEIHGSGSILNEAGDFPSPLLCSFPLHSEAKHYYERGLSFLYRHLPFYIASGLDRLAILLLPFVGLLIPIVRLLPPVYNWTMKRKIYQRYRMLQRLENKVGLVPFDDLMLELSEIEAAARKLASMPAAYGADIYALRSNLERVRDRILASQGGTPVLTLATADRSFHRKPGKSDAPPATDQQPSKAGKPEEHNNS